MEAGSHAVAASAAGGGEIGDMGGSAESQAQADIIGLEFASIAEHLEDVNGVRERLRDIATRLDNVCRRMHSELLTIHGVGSDAVAAAVGRAKALIPQVQSLYEELATTMDARPGEYYRFNDHWRSQSSTASFLMCYIHWLETGMLLPHAKVEEKLKLDHKRFGVDLEDYLIGVCTLSNELPRFVINRVTLGDYDCPRTVALFLNDLFAAFRKLNLRNDLLRKRFDGIKYDLKKVEEVLYDVEIRGLTSQKQHAEQQQG